MKWGIITIAACIVVFILSYIMVKKRVLLAKFFQIEPDTYDVIDRLKELVNEIFEEGKMSTKVDNIKNIAIKIDKRDGKTVNVVAKTASTCITRSEDELEAIIESKNYTDFELVLFVAGSIFAVALIVFETICLIRFFMGM